MIPVDSVDALKDMGHGVDLTRKGVSGSVQNQRMGFTMSINNPALTRPDTGQRRPRRQASGSLAAIHFLIEIPPIHLLAGETEDLVRRLV